MATQTSFQMRWEFIKSKVAYTFGLADSIRSAEISDLIDKINSLTLITLMYRKGYNQDGKPWSIHFDKLNSLFRLCMVLFILRFVVLIITDESSNISMILGNAFYASSSSSTFCLLELIYFALPLAAREYILYLESKGHYIFLLEIKVMKSSFNCYALKLSPVQFDIFKRRIQFTLFNWSNFIYPFAWLFATGMAIIRLTNVQVYSNYIYLISSAIWFIPETSLVIFLVGGCAGVATYTLIFPYLYLARLQSQLDRLKMSHQSVQFSQMNHILKSINFNLQQIFINYNRLADDLRYLFGYCLAGNSFLLVTAVAASSFLKLHSKLLANLILIITFFGVICVTAILHASALVYNKFNQICGYYSSFMARHCDVHIHNGLKILHILEKCSYNGIKIGDLTLLTSKFLCYVRNYTVSAN